MDPDFSSDRALRREPEAAVRDRELLELAALAAGYKATAIYGSGFHVANAADPDFDDYIWWNPLKSNGDVFRLMVTLLIRVSPNRMLGDRRCGSVTVEYPDKDGFYIALAEVVGLGADPCAATRRAVVRAAAAIGSELRKAASGCSHTDGPDEQSKVDDQELTTGSSHG